MINNILDTIRAFLLATNSRFKNGFVAIDYNRDGYFITQNEQLLNFEENFGNHFYLRVTDKIQLTPSHKSSCEKEYIATAPVKLVGFFLNTNESADNLAGEIIAQLSQAESANNLSEQFNINILTIDLDKYAVMSEETPSNVEADLDNKKIISIDFTIMFIWDISCTKQVCCQ